MCWDAIMKNSEYFTILTARFLRVQDLYKVLNSYGRVLNMSGQFFHRVLNKPADVNTPELRIQEGCEYGRVILGARVCLNMP